MLDPIEIAVSAVVLAIAAFTIGAIGFGFGLTTTPVMLLYLGPQTVVVVVNAVAILAFGLMLFETRREIRYRELTLLWRSRAFWARLSACTPSPRSIPHALRIGIAVLVLALTVLVIMNRKWRVPKPQVTGPVTGFCASAIGDGPWRSEAPYSSSSCWDAAWNDKACGPRWHFLFTVMYCTAVAGYAIQGLITTDTPPADGRSHPRGGNRDTGSRCV